MVSMEPDTHSRREKLACLQEAVRQQLHSSGYLSLKKLNYEIEDDVVTLSGRVPTFHLKQIAQTVLLRLPGIRSVRNHVQVG